MRRKVFATLCAATLFFGAVSVAAPQGVKAAPAPLASYDFEDGMGDMEPAANGETAAPSLATDEIKGGAIKLEFGANGAESYTTFANPYVGKELSAATITAWVNVPEDAGFWEWDCLFGFTDGVKKLTFQTRPYLCWNAGGEDANFIDLKGPLVFDNQKGRWVNYAVVITPEGQTLFINGEEVTTPEIGNGEGYNAADLLPFLSAETQDSAICESFCPREAASSFSARILASRPSVSSFAIHVLPFPMRESAGMPFRYLSVSIPWERGENTARPMPFSLANLSSPSCSIHRLSME